MTTKTTFSIALFLLIIALPSWSQNDPKATSIPSIPEEAVLDETEKEVKETAPEKKPTRKAKANQEVFIPSEEISEDKPVPFPIDI